MRLGGTCMEVTNRIKDDFGTLRRYAKLKNLNYTSLRCTLARMQKTKYVVRQLKKDGYWQYIQTNGG